MTSKILKIVLITILSIILFVTINIGFEVIESKNNNQVDFNLEKYGENSKYIQITIDIVKDVEENNIEE